MLVEREPLTRVSRSLVVCTLVAVAAIPAASKTKRELAAEQYRHAQTLLEDLKAVPPLELSAKQYKLVAEAFRKVHWITPASSYCDDALLAAADVEAMKITRFGPEPYRDTAIAAYRFLLREYPHSQLLAQARESIRAIESGSIPGPDEPVVAEAAPPTTAPTPAVEPAEEATQPSEEPEVVAVSLPPAAKPLEDSAQPAPPRLLKSTAEVKDLRYWSTPESTRIVVELNDFVDYKFDFLSRPRRLYFDLFTSRLSGALTGGANYEVGDSAVARVRIGQNRTTKSRMVLDLLDEVSYDVSWLTNPPRLVIELRGKTPPRPAPAVQPEVQLARANPPTAGRVENPSAAPLQTSYAPPKAAQATSRGSQSLIRALGLKISRVVIDAGHGGHDTGSIGPSGLREKDVTLDVALRLGQLIEDELHAEVIYTRDSDTYPELTERTRLANSAQADLFISVHANSVKSRSVRGVETFYLNFTTDPWAMKVAARENAASNSTVHELEDLLGKIAKKDRIEESSEFAAKVQSALYAGLAENTAGLRNRGVRKAPMIVLIGAKMPAILAEIGFLSNPTDEKLLKTSKYRQQVAKSIFEGVRNYVDTLSSHEIMMTESETPSAGASLD